MGEISTAVNHAHRFAPAAPDEDLVFGACAPGWHTAADHAMAVGDWIDFMRERGIERVCCLLSGSGLEGPDGNVGRCRRAFGDDAVLHAPIPDTHLVDAATLEEEILPFLDAAVARDAPVVVHCLAGLGRTGQVLTAWLTARRGYEPREAVDAVQAAGRDPRDVVKQGNATIAEFRRVLRTVQ